MQKKTVQIIHGVRPRTTTKPLFEGAKILNINQKMNTLFKVFELRTLST